VIGGLIFSTALTLLIVPASFSIALDVERWIGRKLGRLMVTDDTPKGVTPAPLPAE
jgi:hypothetical protein